VRECAASKIACRFCASLRYITASQTSRCMETLEVTSPGIFDNYPPDSKLDSESESKLEPRHESACVLLSSVPGVKIMLLWSESVSEVLSSLFLLTSAAPWRSIIAHSILLACQLRQYHPQYGGTILKQAFANRENFLSLWNFLGDQIEP
jgi:hypothetical protein